MSLSRAAVFAAKVAGLLGAAAIAAAALTGTSAVVMAEGSTPPPATPNGHSWSG